ncbi:MAG: GIY-YIG nuclease family protein, partial [Fidelibacterota bacterium]
MYFTYILYSETSDRYYIGYTSDLSKRLEKHNNGNSRSTKSG